jgi:phospholipase C
MKKMIASLALAATACVGSMYGEEGSSPKGIPHLDHVFVIMMENHSYGQLVGNPNAPFINHYMETANAGVNYFAVAHPSLTNYLEVVGGSNFGVLSDSAPDWHNAACLPNLLTDTVDNEAAGTPVCPIYGKGTDAATPAIDYSNETSGPPGDINIDGTMSIAASSNIHGKTIADQLVENGLTWKSYQENLPLQGADYVNTSDGTYTDKSVLPAGVGTGGIVALYAAKHNPFVYFRSVQDGFDSELSLRRVVGFDGVGGLYEDLGKGKAPNFSFIVPNQCNDQHGRGNAGAICNYDPNDNGTQTGLNDGLIYQGDVTVQRIVTAIKNSRVWQDGNNAIVVLWDENDYSVAPTTNQVLLIVDTNYGRHGVKSPTFYDHFSLLRTIEAGFELPCLNHACDKASKVMSDLFATK